MTTSLLTAPITNNSVILPLIRRVMPTVIANQIIGVQPMTGHVGSIFSTNGIRLYRPPRIKMTNMHYKVFLRLNNRKKSQTADDLLKAKYPYMPFHFTVLDNATDCIEWCDQQFTKYGYILDKGVLWFENDNDVTLFKLRWL